ncbi:hypothetical protein BHM03_00018435 [Ensete ventricosum]|nr:hypothetical protein BHM03_00018435 [Ensete ventricosum]
MEVPPTIKLALFRMVKSDVSCSDTGTSSLLIEVERGIPPHVVDRSSLDLIILMTFSVSLFSIAGSTDGCSCSACAAMRVTLPYIWSQRASWVGLTTPGRRAPSAFSKYDTSAYATGGFDRAGSAVAPPDRTGSALPLWGSLSPEPGRTALAILLSGSDPFGSHRFPNRVPLVRNSCARHPARSRLSLARTGPGPAGDRAPGESDGSRSFRFLNPPAAASPARTWLDMITPAAVARRRGRGPSKGRAKGEIGERKEDEEDDLRGEKRRRGEVEG